GPIAPREDALSQGREDHLTDPLAFAERNNLPLNGTVEHAVLRLAGDDLVDIVLAGEGYGAGDLRGRPLADPSVEHLPLGDQVIDGAERLIDRSSRVESVALVEVDIVHAEPLER